MFSRILSSFRSQTTEASTRPDKTASANGQSTQPTIPSRIIIESIRPQIDGGQFAIKRVPGDTVEVTAHIYADGHEVLRGVIRLRMPGKSSWIEIPLEEHPNDEWSGSFLVDQVGSYEYLVAAWIDRFAGWRRDTIKKVEAGQDVHSELLEGAELIRDASTRATGHLEEVTLRGLAETISSDRAQHERVEQAFREDLFDLMRRFGARSNLTESAPTLRVTVDPYLARFGAWYEMFPRSASNDPSRHGTFNDVIGLLPYVADMGFDILYLPPIHPIGTSYRKGPNNSLAARPGDLGSPWAIGAPEGGHKAILRDLGTPEDFRRLVAEAKKRGIQIALDIAFQCSPDHPYVKEHPDWFRHRPDGSIKYAENPPKKYQDIYPIDFEGEAWQGLYQELRDVFLHWVEQGVTVFRVDNPHTKPFRFWDWCIGEIKAKHPEVIFLSEAFTRPKLMKYLAKAGFTQSYTYFTWRNTKADLTEYLTELTLEECREYMRPNFFANTPDILHAYLQHGGRSAFLVRFVLAATLSPAYGIYGPPFELCVGTPVREGSEEYLDSEKYQQRHWNLDDPITIRETIARLNQTRRGHRALQELTNLEFFETNNDQVLYYGKATADRSDVFLVAVNLDPHQTQTARVSHPVEFLGVDPSGYVVHDVLSDQQFYWTGSDNIVILDPNQCPAHVFHVRQA